jgi:hypothetical protein
MASNFWDRPLGWKAQAIGGAATGVFGWFLMIMGEWNINRFTLGILTVFVITGAIVGAVIDRPKE